MKHRQVLDPKTVALFSAAYLQQVREARAPKGVTLSQADRERLSRPDKKSNGGKVFWIDRGPAKSFKNVLVKTLRPGKAPF